MIPTMTPCTSGRRRAFGANGFGVTPYSLGKPSAVYPTAVAGDSDLIIAVDLQQTALASSMATTDLSMTVVSPSEIVAYSLLTIDSEIVKVTGPAVGNTVPISRGFDGTAAAVHLAGATVSGYIDAYHHNRLVAEIEAIEQTLGPNLSNVSGSAFTVATAYNFVPQSPGGNLTVGTNMITLAPVPQGVNGTDTRHYLYISGGTGTPEAVLITGGSAVGGAASGTLFVTCANTHSGAWTIGSATSGGQEAMYSSTGPMLVLYPAGSFNMYAALYYPRDGISVSGLGYDVTTLVWQLNINGDLIYAAGTGGTSPTPRMGAQLSDLSIFSTPAQTAGAAFHCFACRYPMVYSVNFQGSNTTATLYHGVWFDQLDYGYVDRTKVVCTQDCIRVDGCVGGGIKAGLFISNALLSSSGVGIHVGGAFGGLYVTNADIIGNNTGVLIDEALAAEPNREILIDGLTSIDSSLTTGIDIVQGLDNGYLGLAGTWISNNKTGIHIRSGAGSEFAIVYVGGTVFNHTTVGIQNDSDTSGMITITGTHFRANAIAVNQTVFSEGAGMDFILNSVRYDLNTTDVSGWTNENFITLLNGVNTNIPRANTHLLNITGPTAGFSISGISGGRAGDVLYLHNTTVQVMTILENDSGSTAGNRILTFQGPLSLRAGQSAVTLVYDNGMWFVAGYN